MSQRPLSSFELEQCLENCLDAVLSTRRTAEAPASELSAFTRRQQEFVLHWLDVIVSSNSEMGFQFVSHVPEALRLLPVPEVEKWIIHFMDVYDREGLYPGSAAVRGVGLFAQECRIESMAVDFSSIVRVLEHFIRGLSGRGLKLEAGEHVFTDTGHIYLPARLAVFVSEKMNFRLYKATAAHLWAQTQFGTFRSTRNGTGLMKVCAGFPQRTRACRLLNALETVRLNACIERELPGLYLEMMALQRELAPIEYPPQWQPSLHRLRKPAATVQDTVDELRRLFSCRQTPPAAFCFQGDLRLEDTETAMRGRQQQEKRAFRLWLRQIALDLKAVEAARETGSAVRFAASWERAPDPQQEMSLVLQFDGTPIDPPDDMQLLSRSILQDFGEIPHDYLMPAGDAAYPGTSRPADLPSNVWEGSYHEEGAHLYNEWDFRRQHYRKDWCVLREIDVHPSDEPYVDEVLRRYSGLISELRKTFEMLRGEDRIARKQSNGDDVDLDAVVEAYADMHAGMEMSERLFTKRRNLERSMAVVFMVDMSGSTKGWINDAERQALVMLCEALELLGDRYAVYGFSGITRKRCELYRVKRFDESYGEAVKRRISGIRPQDYTRMGVIIRHLTDMLEKIEARTKLLITLSDGKPDDYDGYRGEYGVEDTRQALIEAKYRGIHPFCITIDKEAHEYLPRMFGAVNYVVIDEVNKLPMKVADIYRKLTT